LNELPSKRDAPKSSQGTGGHMPPAGILLSIWRNFFSWRRNDRIDRLGRRERGPLTACDQG
jgi:hypothetical protein